MTAAAAATHDRRRVLFAYAALVAGAVAMGASPVFVRLADVGPYASAFWRTFLALPFLFMWMRFENRAVIPAPLAGKGGGREASPGWGLDRKEPHPSPRSLALARSHPALAGEGLRLDAPLVLAGLLFTGDLFFWHLAILNTTVANATFLATTSPIWVALGAWLLRSEAVRWRTLAGLALCLAGGFALIGESYGFAPQRLAGDLFGLATAAFFGAYVLAVRVARTRHGAATLMFVSTAITAVCLFVIAAAFEPQLAPRSLGGLAALAALALVSQVGGQGLLSVALGTLPATFSSLVIFLEAIAAAAFGWVLLGEALGLAQALGGLFILAGIWVARPRAVSPAVGTTP